MTGTKFLIKLTIKKKVFYLLSGASISFLWSVVCGDPISKLLSTFEIRNSLISVFLLIDSILKNSATVNNNEIKDRNEEPLWKTSPHLEEVFLLVSMIGSKQQLDCCVIGTFDGNFVFLCNGYIET